MSDGQFQGKVVVEWLENQGADRNMRLAEPFAFVDADGLRWDVPKGAVINGASIPQIFWTTFGPPFVGDYRRASVVHDHYCDVKTREAAATHRMFLGACLAGGVSEVRAKTMYLAVRSFGPYWTAAPATFQGKTFSPQSATKPMPLRASMSIDEFMEMKNRIEQDNPGVDAIDAMIVERARIMPVVTSDSPLM